MRTSTLIRSVALLSFSLHTYAQRPAIFYVADPAALNVSEQMVVDRLTVMGFTVTPIDDNLSDPADATGQELIVISSTVGSGNIATKHTATAVPIVNWEVNLLDELGIQANNANGISITASQIQISDASHPLAAGLPAGVVNFCNPAAALSAADAAIASVNVVARDVGGTGSFIIGVEKGAALNPARIASAPARRVAFPMNDDVFRTLTDDGLTLFDAAINWAAGPTNAPAGVAQNPTNLTVFENQSAAFSVILTGAPPWSFQWQRSVGDGSFTNIPGAGSRVLTLSKLKLTDSNASFRVQVGNGFGNATSSAATLTVNPDTTAPTIAEALTRGDPNGLFVIFSEQVSASTATNKDNYTINNSVSVNSASLQDDGLTVLLTTSAISSGTSYVLTVGGVQDTAAVPNTIVANSQIQFFQTDGVIERRVFFVSGGTIAAITNSAKFTNNQPDQVTYPDAFEGPVNFADNYGTQFRGYVTAPVSGNYAFFISSDDNSSLYLSTDENPSNKKLIATETVYSNSRQWVSSAGASDLTAKRSDQYAGTEWPGGNTITLTAGIRYYIEAVHAEGGGGDDIAVTWQLPGALEPVDGDPPIPGRYLSAFGTTSGPVAITSPPDSPPVQEPGSVTLKLGTSGSPPFTYQWYRDGTAIPGATNSSYSIALVRRSDNGARFKASVANAFSSATSSEATLTVIPDTTPPRPVQIVSVDGTFTAITMTYNELLDKASAETTQNYMFSPGNIIATNVTLDATLTNVTIRTGTALTPGVTNTLTVNGVKDLSGNAVPSNTSIQFVFNPVTYAANILFDGPIAYYQFEEPTASTVATNKGSTGGDGLYVSDVGGGGPAKGDPGPRPPAFVGFDTNNRAASFDGQGDWIDTQNQFLQDRGAFTLEYWVAPSNRVSDPTTFGTRIGIVGQNDAIEYGFIDQNTIQIWSPNGGSLNTAYSFPDSQWHHVATIADGTTLKTYYDGVLQATGGAATADYGASTFNVHIGGGGVFDITGNYFTGNIDEVAIFDKAIPAARVAAHYAAGKSGGVLVTSGAVAIPAGIGLSVSRSGDTLATSWTPAATGDILESTSLLPPTTWTPVGTNSPVNVTIGTGNLFLRVRRP
jgi:hypothetical protein